MTLVGGGLTMAASCCYYYFPTLPISDGDPSKKPWWFVSEWLRTTPSPPPICPHRLLSPVPNRYPRSLRPDRRGHPGGGGGGHQPFLKKTSVFFSENRGSKIEWFGGPRTFFRRSYTLSALRFASSFAASSWEFSSPRHTVACGTPRDTGFSVRPPVPNN